jgi:hypothetical protein
MMTSWPMDTCWMSSSDTTSQAPQQQRQQLQQQQVRHGLCSLYDIVGCSWLAALGHA